MRFPSVVRTFRICEPHGIAPALLHVDAEPDDERRGDAEREEEGEAFPVVSCGDAIGKRGEGRGGRKRMDGDGD
jgi:hypothetical protein